MIVFGVVRISQMVWISFADSARSLIDILGTCMLLAVSIPPGGRQPQPLSQSKNKGIENPGTPNIYSRRLCWSSLSRHQIPTSNHQISTIEKIPLTTLTFLPSTCLKVPCR